MALPNLSPANDFAAFAQLKDISPSTGAVTDLTAGTITAFIAIDNLPTSVAANGALSMSAVNLSAVKPGKWLIFFDASVLTAALLEPLFGAGVTPYLFIVYPSGFRKSAAIPYVSAPAATVA